MFTLVAIRDTIRLLITLVANIFSIYHLIGFFFLYDLFLI